MKKTLADRFWMKVIKTDGCWKWTGAKHPFGYGMIRAGGTQEKITSSRASWLVHFGDIPPGMMVCHKCDNPECTNPEHLFLGTGTDNMEDREDKSRGIRHFDQTTCNIIHTLVTLGASIHSVARAFQVDRNVVRTAVKKGTMLPPVFKRQVREPKPKSPPPIHVGEDNHKAKVTAEDVLQIRKMRADGVPVKEIAALFPIGKSMIYHICTRRCWTHI